MMDYQVQMSDEKGAVRQIRLLYANTKSYYASALVGVELLDENGETILCTETMIQYQKEAK